MVLTHIVLSRNVQQAQGLKKPIYQSLTNCKCPSICFIPRTYRCVGYCAHWGCCHPSYWECLWHSWASPLLSERQGWSFTAWSQLWWGSACLSVCLSVCLPVCLSVCLPVCLPVSLSVCLSVCLPVCLSVCLSVWALSAQCMSTKCWKAEHVHCCHWPVCFCVCFFRTCCLSDQLFNTLSGTVQY